MVSTCSSSAATSTTATCPALVRITEVSFEHRDGALGIDRGANREPSASNSVALELPPIVGRLAADFDGLPEIVDGGPWRVRPGDLGHDDRPDRRHDER